MSLAFSASTALPVSARSTLAVCRSAPAPAASPSWAGGYGVGVFARSARRGAAPARTRMQAGGAAAAGGDSDAFAPTSESLLSTGSPIEDDGEDEEIELEDGEEVKVLSPPQSYVNAAAIAEAREKFRRHETDSGSAEYQIATLTTRINYLTEHLKKHPKDYSSTRGLLKLVGTRRRLLKWLKKEDASRFDAIISGMKIRVSQELRAM